MGFASFGVNLGGNEARKRGCLGVLGFGDRAISESVLSRKGHVKLGFRHDYCSDKSERVPFVSCENVLWCHGPRGIQGGSSDSFPFSNPV